MKYASLLAACALATLAACATDPFGHRDANCDPDDRLADLMHVWQDCRSGDCDGTRGSGRTHVLIDCDRIQNEIERLSLQFPQHVPTLMANATIAYDHREAVKAQRYLDALFSIEPIHPEAAILRSRIAIEQGNHAAAARLLETQVAYTPDHAGLREAQSAELYMTGDLANARTALDVAEALGAPAWRIAYNRGLIAEAAGDASAAQKQYEAAVAGNPGFAAARSRLSGMRAKGGYNPPPNPPGKAGGS